MFRICKRDAFPIEIITLKNQPKGRWVRLVKVGGYQIYCTTVSTELMVLAKVCTILPELTVSMLASSCWMYTINIEITSASCAPPPCGHSSASPPLLPSLSSLKSVGDTTSKRWRGVGKMFSLLLKLSHHTN